MLPQSITKACYMNIVTYKSGAQYAAQRLASSLHCFTAAQYNAAEQLSQFDSLAMSLTS